MPRMEDSREEDVSDIAEKSSTLDILKISFDFDSDAVLGYPNYAEHAERLHRYHWKVKKSTLPGPEGLITKLSGLGGLVLLCILLE